MSPSSTRDIVVIGASAGGIQPLRELLTGLPRDFLAAVFVVMHVGEGSRLDAALNYGIALPLQWPESGSRIAPGRILLAPAGRHLLLHDGHVLLRRGPRENLSRPSIDVLFRSAAATFGGRVIGIVLSGALDDGAAGLVAIKRCGGMALVQDPADAADPDMPKSALRAVLADHVVKSAELGLLLQRLVQLPAGETPAVPLNIRLESAIAAQQLTDIEATYKLGQLSPFTCPECNGSLWEIDEGSLLRYRCHVGHAFTDETMLAAQASEIDRMLESLLRLRQERAELMRRVVEKERGRNRPDLTNQFEIRAREYEEDARLMRLLILGEQGGREQADAGGDLRGDDTARVESQRQRRRS
jgi:two-component system chemotaxis response regulator CheB